MEQPMRVLVTGSNGLLGSKLLAAMSERADLIPLASSRSASPLAPIAGVPYFPLDVTDEAALSRVVDETRPEAVIHTAAMTDVDGCERDPEGAWILNVQGTRNVASACERIGASLIHISSEYVFDGREGPYVETDRPNALSVYGRTKLASEEAVARCSQRWVVARTTVLFGHAPSARRHFVLWLLGQLARGESVRIVDDQVGSPTLADNLAEMLLALTTRGGQGIYHTVGASRLSRYEFARQIAEVFGLDPAGVQPISTAELRQPAPRPLRAGLSTGKLEREFPDVRVLDSRTALRRLREQLATSGVLRELLAVEDRE
jgi:dTDP-4-dehydrorhamnose reductase